MYIPSHFSETRTDVLHGLIREFPLGTLLVAGSQGLEANHIPFHLAVEEAGTVVLMGHLARANPLWADAPASKEALVIFKGPDTYISPGWYPSKRGDGKVVPTWNYVAAHAYGTLNFHEDPIWIKRQLELLTDRMEAGQLHPWAVSDAPPEYVDRLVASVVGIEIDVWQLVGKWKVSQNQSPENRIGVMNGLESSACPFRVEMARIVGEHAKDTR